jgi:hypothetical protein
MRLQVLHPYKTTGTVTVKYIFLFVFLYSERKENDPRPNGGQAVCELNLHLISSCMRFWFVMVVPKYLKYRHVLQFVSPQYAVILSCIVPSTREGIGLLLGYEREGCACADGTTWSHERACAADNWGNNFGLLGVRVSDTSGSVA